MKYYEIKQIASTLRKQQTPSERLLWSYLKKRQLKGRKFLRQHPIKYESVNNEHFFFIPDFYCSQEKLIIELDGAVHINQKEKDQRRELILKSINLKVLRINNEELIDIDAVLKKISQQFIR
jgi:very-short-patch-repair endonuclease